MASVRHIPEDITIQILSRLPVKSLMRFLCVCKRWSLVINDPTFVARHHTQTSLNSNGGSLLITSQAYADNRDAYINVFADGAFDAPMTHCQNVLPSLGLNGYMDIYSSNGLLCIDADEYSFIIWNPATRQIREIPKQELFRYRDVYSFLGFGVIPETNDYKLIGIHQYDPDDHEIYQEMGIDHIQIYSKYSTWREIDAPALTAGLTHKTMEFDKYTQIQVKGVLYWIAASTVDGSRCDLIMGFDLDEEKLFQLAMPRGKICTCLLTVIKGSLALITSDSRGKRGISRYNQVWTINDRPGDGEGWVMKFRLQHLTVDWVWKNYSVAWKRSRCSNDDDGNNKLLLSLQRLDVDQSLSVPEIKKFSVPLKSCHQLQFHNYIESLIHV